MEKAPVKNKRAKKKSVNQSTVPHRRLIPLPGITSNNRKNRTPIGSGRSAAKALSFPLPFLKIFLFVRECQIPPPLFVQMHRVQPPYATILFVAHRPTIKIVSILSGRMRRAHEPTVDIRMQLHTTRRSCPDCRLPSIFTSLSFSRNAC